MVSVIKANGEIEEFSETKVKNSISRAGIPKSIEDQVLNHVKEKLYDNIPTVEIYQHILEFLETSPTPYTKSRYSLKQAIMQLGPTGYPFEDYVAEILKTMGYSTKTRTVLFGKCIQHEIDVIATKDNKKIMVEAKFHNGVGIYTDSHVSMYTKARFDDVKEKHGFTEGWLITNTKATLDAFSYGACVDLKVIGWSLPEGESLRDLVEKAKLIPITALTTLSTRHRQILLENHFVLCKDIVAHPEYLNLLDVSNEKKEQVLDEAKFVIG